MCLSQLHELLRKLVVEIILCAEQLMLFYTSFIIDVVSKMDQLGTLALTDFSSTFEICSSFISM